MNLLFDNNCVSNSPSKIDQCMIYSSNNNFAIAIPLCPSGTSPSLGEELSLDYTFCNNLIKMLML